MAAAVEPGARILVQSAPGPGFAAALFAAGRTNVVLVPLDAVSQLSKDFSDKIDKLQEQMDRDNRTNRVELTNLFQEICRERQGACGKLQLANFAAIELRVSTACQKIEKINEDRERRWERQDQINDQIKRVLYQSSDGGHSWQLKQNTGGKEYG